MTSSRLRSKLSKPASDYCVASAVVTSADFGRLIFWRRYVDVGYPGPPSCGPLTDRLLILVSRIPLEILEEQTFTHLRPAWLRPVRKRQTSTRTAHAPSELNGFASPMGAVRSADSILTWSEQSSSAQAPGLVNINSMFDPQFIAAQGGFMHPLTQGTVAPLTADMFGSNEISGFSADDLLALLGGANGQGGASLGYSLLQPPVPFTINSDMGPSMAPSLSDETSP